MHCDHFNVYITGTDLRLVLFSLQNTFKILAGREILWTGNAAQDIVNYEDIGGAVQVK